MISTARACSDHVMHLQLEGLKARAIHMKSRDEYAPFARESNARAHDDGSVRLKEINCAARMRSGEKCDFNPEGIFERKKLEN